MTLHSRKV